MSYRKATEQDIPSLIQLAEQFHLFGPYREEAFSKSLVQDYLEGFLSRADARIYMTENAAIGMSVSYTEIYNKPFVKEHFFYAKRGEGAELLESLEAFAKQNGGLPIALSAMSQDGKDTKLHTRLFARSGFTVSETIYIKGM